MEERKDTRLYDNGYRVEKISSLNNKGYALSKLKLFDDALKCYDAALNLDSSDISIIVNKISVLRKKGDYAKALQYCNVILDENPNYNIALYHKERILFHLENFTESLKCCNQILFDYPKNTDILYDKACNLIMLSKISEGLGVLEQIISQDIRYKHKARNSDCFKPLMNDKKFQQLIS